MRRSQLLLAVVVLVAVTALWWLFVMAPRNDRLAELQDALDAARDRELVLRGELSRLEEIALQESTYLAAIGEMQTAIPDRPEIAGFLEELNFLADRTGVELVSMSLAPPSPPEADGPFEIRVSVNLEGQYFEILGFLYGLEAMDRLVRVETITMTPIREAEDEGEAGPPDAATTTTLPRPRPAVTTLQVELDLQLFTRGALAVAPSEPPPEAPPSPGDGESEVPPDEGGPGE